MADEVYQENIWRPDRPFVSFRKVHAARGKQGRGASPLACVVYTSISTSVCT